jgi:hypothetical protein
VLFIRKYKGGMRIALNPCSQKNGWKSQIVLLSTEDIEKA